MPTHAEIATAATTGDVATCRTYIQAIADGGFTNAETAVGQIAALFLRMDELRGTGVEFALPVADPTEAGDLWADSGIVTVSAG